MKHKKFLIVPVAACFLLFALAFAQTWHTANQSTVEWDAVTTLNDGSPIPADNVIEYTVYLANAVTDADKENPVQLLTITGTKQTITLNIEGRYFVGVQAIRKDSAGVIIGESNISWSDDPEDVFEGQTFGIQYFLPPADPRGLRPLPEP